MLAFAAAVLIAQVAADGKRIDGDIPDSLVTWRWTTHQDRAVLGWGRINANGNFVPVSPHPPWPLYRPQVDQTGEKPPTSGPVGAEKPPSAAIDPNDDHSPIPSKQDGPTIGALPAFAVNGVVTEKIASDGVTLRASDPATAAEGRRILTETKVDAEKKAPDDSAIKIPTPTVQIGPDFEKLGLYGLAVALACFAGWIYRSPSTHSNTQT